MSGTDSTQGPRLPSFGSFVPRIDTSRCLLARAACSSCRVCADACPTAALAAGPDGLTIEESRCLGCGLCVPACPEAAIASPSRFDLSNHHGSRVLFLACMAVRDNDGDGREAIPDCIPCLHMLGLRDLAAITDQGAEAVVACCGDCASCLELRGPRFADTAALFGSLLTARALPAPRFQFVTKAQFLRLRQEAAPPGDSRMLGRRAFLSMFSAPAAKAEVRRDAFGIALTAPDNVTAFRPAIDGRKCSGCDACIHVCPHGALRLEPCDPHKAYVITASACTNCRLCRDICAENAIDIATAGQPQQFQLPLAAMRCQRCGVPGHIPAQQPPRPYCRVCAGLDGRQRLFQVQD